MRTYRALLCCVCVAAAALLASCKRSESSGGAGTTPALRPLNLVVVTIDTLRPDHLHCYGYSKIETPNLDAIARDGVLFENAVTETPVKMLACEHLHRPESSRPSRPGHGRIRPATLHGHPGHHSAAAGPGYRRVHQFRGFEEALRIQ